MRGVRTGQVFPTGKCIDMIDGIEVTCIDAAMLLMIVRAGDLGVTGREKPVALDANTALLDRLESLRLEAGHCERPAARRREFGRDRGRTRQSATDAQAGDKPKCGHGQDVRRKADTTLHRPALPLRPVHPLIPT